MSGNGNRDFENGEMQLWSRNKNMIQENKGVPLLQVRKKGFGEYYKMFNMELNLNTHGVRV